MSQEPCEDQVFFTWTDSGRQTQRRQCGHRRVKQTAARVMPFPRKNKVLRSDYLHEGLSEHEPYEEADPDPYDIQAVGQLGDTQPGLEGQLGAVGQLQGTRLALVSRRPGFRSGAFARASRGV